MDTQHYKTILEAEKSKLEEGLDALGQRDPEHKETWDVKRADLDISTADENEVADNAEESHIDSIVLDELEMRYRLVLHALKKIEEGTFGVCEVSGDPIEEARLLANPAARTCKAHLVEEGNLPL